MTTKTTTIEQALFLRMAVNILHSYFFQGTRTETKQRFRQIFDGIQLPITRVRMADGSEVRFDVALDHQQNNRKFNFSEFRQNLLVLLSNINEKLEQKEAIPTFVPQNEGNDGNTADSKLIFGVFSAINIDNSLQTMALGIDTGERENAVAKLQLIYLNPEHFSLSA